MSKMRKNNQNYIKKGENKVVNFRGSTRLVCLFYRKIIFSLFVFVSIIQL